MFPYDAAKGGLKQHLDAVSGRSVFDFQLPIPLPVHPAPAFVVVGFQSLPSLREHSPQKR
jgi:hypothetical protein